MRIVFYTSGTTGSGRIVRGISIGNAIRRMNLDWEYTIVNLSPLAHLIDIFGYKHIEIPPEEESQLTRDNYSSSVLYRTINSLNPDVLIIDLLWFPLYHFIRDLSCKKIFLSHYVEENFFTLPLTNETLYFRIEDYDRLLAIEPFRSKIPFNEINPIIIRNKDEILTRGEAMQELQLSDDRKNCLYAFNGNPEDFERHRKKYSHLEGEGYKIVYSTNYKGGLFPAVDYYNAFDFIICAASYNQFWEVIYLNKKAAFENVPSNFSSSERRIKKFLKYRFDVNGADELIECILNL